MSLIFRGESISLPSDLENKVISFQDLPKIKFPDRCTSPRKRPPTQFVIHRGSESVVKGCMPTFNILLRRNLSSSWTLDTSGILYQHIDDGINRGRHTTHHNILSSSLDIAGPFTYRADNPKKLPVETTPVAIGLSKKKIAVENRVMVPFRHYSMTPEQTETLKHFLPFYLDLLGIPKVFCSEQRCFRTVNTHTDPVTEFAGLVSHSQVAMPGTRVDGIEVIKLLTEFGSSLGFTEVRSII